MKEISLIFLLTISSVTSSTVTSFKWICTDKNCQRTDINSQSTLPTFETIELCKLACGDYGALWPKPHNVRFTNRNLTTINPSNITFNVASKYDDEVMKRVTTIFRNNLAQESDRCTSYQNVQVNITITISSGMKRLDWNTDESYTLNVEKLNENVIKVSITGRNIFGARHALETFSQLIASHPEPDKSTCLAVVSGVTIDDKPFYSHRGLLLDTSRNFLSIKTIKHHIQAMAASKMNVLHWHITDSHSFPMETPSVPNMTIYGAYSKSKVYKYKEISSLIRYALYRGVKVVLELDAPAHAGYGWQWGPEAGLGNLTVCLNEQPWRRACIQPPCGQLNPSNHKVYDVLENIYKDIIRLAPATKVFHMGGDELFIECWNTTSEILEYIGNKPRTSKTFLDLWSEFQLEALKRYDKAVGHTNTKVVLWTSHLTDPSYIERYLDKNRYVIQTWVPNTDTLPDDLLKLGYKLIISTKNAWYLDHGFWGTTKYYDWRTVYQNRLTPHQNVIGGEVCMWGEYVDDEGVIQRTWPRAAGAAERLWSNPNLETKEVEGRFYRHRERLVTRGIRADAVVPRWCYYNEGLC